MPYRMTAALALALLLPNAIAGELDPIHTADWNRATAAHLLERAGFGGTPADIERFANMDARTAVRSLVYIESVAANNLPPFEHSGIFEPALDPFPPSRPATTRLAEETGEALGIKVRSGGNRPLQPIVNKFFYWLRASRLETDRVAQWWAERMLITHQPLREKMALFWHGHFATNEDKVRDYRKMLIQLQMFQAKGMGNFRDLLIATAQDPAMLAYLDAGVNVKGSPNENFAREIMELFTMGVGHYSEQDIREAARAFTGWNFVGTEFSIDPTKHDDDMKRFFGNEGRFNGEQIIDMILDHPTTAQFIASKIYRFFVSDKIDEQLSQTLGAELRSHGYALQPFLETLLMSQAFYDNQHIGAHIKSPVELVVSTYRKLGLDNLPGAPDFNVVTGSLGQHLLHPPTVAGWRQGRSWITPSLLMERGNFALNLLFPDIEFIPQDRFPIYPTGEQIRAVHQRLRKGEDIATATRPVGMAANTAADKLAASNQVDRKEAFNTRYGSYRGWQMAIERVKPIERDLPRIDLTRMVLENGLSTPEAVVDYFVSRFFRCRFQKKLNSNTLICSPIASAAATYLQTPQRWKNHCAFCCMPCSADRNINWGRPTMITRRSALRSILATGAYALTKHGLAAAEDDRILVVFELSGGNDGLNTIVPYTDDHYYRRRPGIGLKPDTLLKLDDRWGMNPGLSGMHRLWQDGHLAIVHGCGYEQPSFSHFTSMAYWHTASPNSGDAYGWVGRLADNLSERPKSNFLINIASSQSLAVASRIHTPVVFDDPERFRRLAFHGEPLPPGSIDDRSTGNSSRDFLNRVALSARGASESIREAARAYSTPIDYGLAPSQLDKVAACISAGIPARLYYVAFGNNAFDTHVQQPNLHRRLLTYAADALHGFLADMERIGMADKVVVLMFSEFGRRVAENANLGTDHGTANTMFLAGKPVQGGHYGRPPELDQLDKTDNLIHTTDFRRVYATAIDAWLGANAANQILKGDFEPLPIFG